MPGKRTLFSLFWTVHITYFFSHMHLLLALGFETTTLNYLANSQRQRPLFFSLLSNLVFGKYQKCNRSPTKEDELHL